MEPEQKKSISEKESVENDWSETDKKIIKKLEEIGENKFYDKTGFYMDLDNFIEDINLNDINWIESYGLCIKLGKLRYRNYKEYINGSDIMYRFISADELVQKLLRLFKIVSLEYFIENIINNVKFVYSDTVIVPESFMVAFPKARFYGFVDDAHLNSMLKHPDKIVRIRCSVQVSNEGKFKTYEYIPSKINEKEFIPRLVKIHVDELKLGDYSDIEEITLIHDQMDKIADIDMDLPKLKILDFSWGHKEYRVLDHILNNHPTIEELKNFEICRSTHVKRTYRRYHMLIKKIHISINGLQSLLNEDKITMEELLNLLLEVEKEIRDDYNYCRKSLVFSGYRPAKEKVLKLSEYFDIEDHWMLREYDLPEYQTDMIHFLNTLEGTTPKKENLIKIKVYLNLDQYVNEIWELARLVISVFNKYNIYYQIDGLIYDLICDIEIDRDDKKINEKNNTIKILKEISKIFSRQRSQN